MKNSLKKITNSLNLNNLEKFTNELMNAFQRNSFRASALTYATLIGIVPLFTVAFSMVSYFSTNKDFYEETLINYLKQLFISEEGFGQGETQVIINKVILTIKDFSENAATLDLYGVLAIIFAIFNYFFFLERALNDIWNIEEDRPIVQKITNYWSTITLGPIIVGAVLYVSKNVIGPNMEFVIDSKLLNLLIPILLLFSFFYMSYALIPNKKNITWYAPLISAICLTISWIGIRYLFTWIAGNLFTNYTHIYGALAIIPIFALILFMGYLLFFAGAEFSSWLHFRQVKLDKKNKNSEYDFDKYKLYFLFETLWEFWLEESKQKADGQAIRIKFHMIYYKLRENGSPITKTQLKTVINILIEENLIRKLGKFLYSLTAKVNEITYTDLYNIINLKQEVPVSKNRKNEESIESYFSKIHQSELEEDINQAKIIQLFHSKQGELENSPKMS